MKGEALAGRVFRRNAAILLSLTMVYSIVTLWIYDAWSWCLIFAATFAIAAALALRALWADFKLQTTWLLVPLAAIALWGPAQLAAGIPEYRFETWWSSLQWAAAAAFFWATLQVLAPARSSAMFRAGAIVFGAFLALEAIIQLFSGEPLIYGVVSLPNGILPMGSFRNRDHYCSLMELLLPIALWSGISNRRRAWISFTAAGVMYASIIASASRAGFVISTLEVLLLLAVGIMRKRTGADSPAGRMTVAIAVLIAIGGGVVGWTPVLDRFQVKDLFLFRREFLQSTLQMIHDRPWFGFGLGSWPLVYRRYALIDPVAIANHAHNDWVEWAANGGIPFALLIAVLALRAFWLSLEFPWGIGIVAVFAHCAIDFPLARPPVLLALLMVLAALEVEHRRRSEGRSFEIVGSKKEVLAQL